MKLKFVLLWLSLKQRWRRLVMRIRGRRPVHFIHVGKTAGTAVKNALEPLVSAGHYEVFLHPHRVKLHHIPRGEKVFFVLRDPVDRFVSAFYSRKRQGMPRVYSPWNADEREAFSRFGTANQLAEALSSADAEEREHARKAMRRMQHVRDTYATFFGDTDAFAARSNDILLVGFQDTLEEDFTRLVHLLGLPASTGLPRDPVKAHRNPEQVDRHLSDLAVANLRMHYAADIAFLEHCRALMRQRGG